MTRSGGDDDDEATCAAVPRNNLVHPLPQPEFAKNGWLRNELAWICIWGGGYKTFVITIILVYGGVVGGGVKQEKSSCACLSEKGNCLSILNDQYRLAGIQMWDMYYIMVHLIAVGFDIPRGQYWDEGWLCGQWLNCWQDYWNHWKGLTPQSNML